MNISGSHPIISNFGIQNFTNKKTNYNNLSPLSKDTVSFGSSASAKKMVEKLKTYNPNGQYDIKQTEAEAIYRYFGFEVENGRSAHKTITGPYGQTFTYSSQTLIDPSHASALIRGIQMADEFNGELILFPKKPQEEVVQKWKQRISERRPTKGFENSYAIDNKERLEELLAQKEAETTTIDPLKEQEKAINEVKSRVSSVLVSLTHQEEDYAALASSYEEIKVNAMENKLELPEDITAPIDKKIEEKKEEFSTAKSTIENYKDKLSKNNLLSEDELANLDEYEENGIDISDLEESIIKCEEIYSQKANEQSELITKIIDEISKFTSNIDLVNSQVKNIKQIIDEANINAAFNDNLINKLNSLYSSLEKKLSNISSKVENYKELETTKKPTSTLKSILNKLKGYNNGDLGESIPELLELNKLIETEVKPILSISEDEKTEKRIARIERFNKKVAQAQVQQTPKKEKIEEQTKTITKVEEPSATPSIEAKPLEKVEVSQAEKTAITLQQQRIQELKYKMAKRISRLPIATVNEAMYKLVNEKFDDLLFAEVQNGNITADEFLSKIATEIAKTQDYNRIRNAAQFALLNSIYTSSINKPSEIFNLHGPQSREVFVAIQKGEREITTSIDGKPLKISIDKNHNLNELDKTFERYNTKIIDIDEATSDLILDELLKYAPTISEKEIPKIIVKLSKEGAYYELLLNKDCNETLKTALLKTFWSNYDSDNKTNYTPQVINKYETEQMKIKEAEMQKRKLQSLSGHNWSL